MGAKNDKVTENVWDDKHTVTEWCQKCGNEITMQWDTDAMGFRAFCPVCGNCLMLCDECMHAENGCGCDYDSETDTCRHNKAYCVGREVHVQNLPEEKPDRSLYTNTEHSGTIMACLDQDTYIVEKPWMILSAHAQNYK